MQVRLRLNQVLRCFCALFVALFTLFSAPAQDGQALAVGHAGESLFRLKLYDIGIKEVCVGQSFTVTGAYWPNRDNAPLAPLVGPDIRTHAVHGTTSPSRIVPGTLSGIFDFTYKAESAGSEEIQASAARSDGSADVTASLKIKVLETCEYKFDLNAELNADVGDSEMSLKFKHTMKISGVLKADDPANPTRYTSYINTVKVATVISDAHFPDCVFISPEVGYGRGLVDVSADLVNDGKSLDVRFAPPEELRWDFDAGLSCKEISVNLVRMVNLTTDKDPWISETVPSTGGSKKIVLDMFSKGVQRMHDAGYQASYTATLTVTRKGAK